MHIERSPITRFSALSVGDAYVRRPGGNVWIKARRNVDDDDRIFACRFRDGLMIHIHEATRDEAVLPVDVCLVDWTPNPDVDEFGDIDSGRCFTLPGKPNHVYLRVDEIDVGRALVLASDNAAARGIIVPLDDNDAIIPLDVVANANG